jgi:hypothetical protein
MPITPSISTIAASLLTVVAVAHGSSEDDQRKLRPMLAGQIERPLRYMPDRGDFLIVNGAEFFNRPLYGGASDFRVDAGDRPEFSIYLPGKGGNLRLGDRPLVFPHMAATRQPHPRRDRWHRRR